MDAMPAAQAPDAATKSADLKRKADSFGMPSESKRWKGSGGGLDLNLCADDGDDGGSGTSNSEDEHVPSDLTNDGEARGDVTDSLDSHCQAAVTFDH